MRHHIYTYIVLSLIGNVLVCGRQLDCSVTPLASYLRLIGFLTFNWIGLDLLLIS